MVIPTVRSNCLLAVEDGRRKSVGIHLVPVENQIVSVVGFFCSTLREETRFSVNN